MVSRMRSGGDVQGAYVIFLSLSLSSSRRASGGRHSSRSLLTTNPSLAFLKTTKTRWICGWRSSPRLCGRTWSLSLKPGAGLSKMMSLKAWPLCQSGRKTLWKCIQLRVQNEVTTQVLAGKRPLDTTENPHDSTKFKFKNFHLFSCQNHLNHCLQDRFN